MHRRGDVVLAGGAADQIDIGDVAFDQRSTLHRVGMAGAEIVQGHRAIAGRGQRLAGVGADIAGAAGDQDGLHDRTPKLTLETVGYRDCVALSTSPPYPTLEFANESEPMLAFIDLAAQQARIRP